MLHLAEQTESIFCALKLSKRWKMRATGAEAKHKWTLTGVYTKEQNYDVLATQVL